MFYNAINKRAASPSSYGMCLQCLLLNSFTLQKSLSFHVHVHLIFMPQVCAAEKATIQPYLLEQLIKCCQGDIRKTIMHLQFWCQSKKYRKG